jgi:hypothetical protein
LSVLNLGNAPNPLPASRLYLDVKEVNIMKLVSALVGIAALGGVVFSTPASAMPVTIPGQAPQATNVEQASYVCNGWGHCWHRPYYSDGYYHAHYYGGSGWHRWGYWHPWHRWGYWHQW